MLSWGVRYVLTVNFLGAEMPFHTVDLAQTLVPHSLPQASQRVTHEHNARTKPLELPDVAQKSTKQNTTIVSPLPPTRFLESFNEIILKLFVSSTLDKEQTLGKINYYPLHQIHYFQSIMLK